MLVDNRSIPHSPASSITSLPASDDISDFSDSDFDIISSSDSTRSHEDDIRAAAAGAPTRASHYSDDEADDHSIEPSLLLDREWYGVIDPQRVRTSPLPAPDNIPSGAIAAIPLALSDEDASVIDALSQSLERSNESIRASSTPINASAANVHFITSPIAPKFRQNSSMQYRSRQLDQGHEDLASPSSSVLQLAFPDPLSPLECSLSSDPALPATPIAESRPGLPENESCPPQEPSVAHMSATPELVNEHPPDITLELQNAHEAEPEIVAASRTAEPYVKVSAHLNLSENDFAAEPAVQETRLNPVDGDTVMRAAHRAYHPFDAFDEYIGEVSKYLLRIVSGNRWTASVYISFVSCKCLSLTVLLSIVSILALLIGGVTYLGSPPTPTPTPSLLIPSSTSLWGLLYPVNKSSLSAQASGESHIGDVASPGSSRDMSLSLFAPWAAAPSPMRGADISSISIPPTGPRGIKRKRGAGNICDDSGKSTIGPSATSAKGVEKLITIDALTPLIDPPSLPARAKSALSLAIDDGVLGSKALANHILSLSEARLFTNGVKNCVYPAASVAYGALSEDVRVLMYALDELLVAIHAQTAQVTSVIGRTRQEATYRHARAKGNARRLKKKGHEVVKGFKRTVGVVVAKGESFKADPKGVIRDIATGMKKDVLEVAEGVREGFRQGLRIRKSKKGTFFCTGSGAFGSSGGDRSDIETQNKKVMKKTWKEKERTKRQAQKEKRERRRALRKDKRAERTATRNEPGGGGFLNMKGWGPEGKNKEKPAAEPASDSGCMACNVRRRLPTKTPF